MSRLAIVEEDPPKKPRRARRGKLHPEARLVEERDRRAAAAVPVPETGWRWPFGYVVKLYGFDGSYRARNARSYEHALEVRGQELRTGAYEKAWIEMRTEPREA